MSHDSRDQLSRGEVDSALAKAIVELDLYRVNRGKDLWATQAVLNFLVDVTNRDRENGKKKPPTIYLLMMTSIEKRFKLKKNYASAYMHLAKRLDKFVKFVDKSNGKIPDKKQLESAVELLDYLKDLRGYIKEYS